MIKGHLLLIGCGNMGGALLAGWLRAAGHDESEAVISVIDRSDRLNGTQAPCPFFTYPSLADMPCNNVPDAIVLAVKPKDIATVAAEAAKIFATAPVYVSVAAGVTTGCIGEAVGKKASVVRAMPNTPSLIARGMTSLVAGDHVTKPQHELCSQLFSAVGKAVWLEQEEQMHAATAMAGSSPAYLFYFAECMVAAGIRHGLSEKIATELAVGALSGSAILAEMSPQPLEKLRTQVTSPNGTTAAALDQFMEKDRLKAVVEDAVKACIHRSKELAN